MHLSAIHWEQVSGSVTLSLEFAVLSALEVSHLYHVEKKVSVVTFGQPRMGNKAFADLVSAAFHGRIFRVTNKSDATPYLPVNGTFNYEWSHHSKVSRDYFLRQLGILD